MSGLEAPSTSSLEVSAELRLVYLDAVRVACEETRTSKPLVSYSHWWRNPVQDSTAKLLKMPFQSRHDSAATTTSKHHKHQPIIRSQTPSQGETAA
jgi:hypothetical protein